MTGMRREQPLILGANLSAQGGTRTQFEAKNNFCQVVQLPHIASSLQEFSSRPVRINTAASEPKPRWRAALGQQETSSRWPGRWLCTALARLPR